METLIDLNNHTQLESHSFSHDQSVLKHTGTTRHDRMKAGLLGALIGSGISLIAGAMIAGILLLFIYDESSGARLDRLIFFGAMFVATGAFAGMLKAVSNLETCARKGYLAINTEKLEYWADGKIISIPLEKIFSAGPEKVTFGEVLRIYYTSDEKRGFSWVKRNFSDFSGVSGPVVKLGNVEKNGNILARMTVKQHLTMRKARGLNIASLPEFAFESVQKQREHLIFGDYRKVAEFSCDGETLFYARRDESYRIPVTAVREAKVTKLQSQYGVTAYYVMLELDPSCGYEKIKVDILGLPHNNEIDNYCRCLPGLIRLAESDGYWG